MPNISLTDNQPVPTGGAKFGKRKQPGSRLSRVGRESILMKRDSLPINEIIKKDGETLMNPLSLTHPFFSFAVEISQIMQPHQHLSPFSIGFTHVNSPLLNRG